MTHPQQDESQGGSTSSALRKNEDTQIFDTSFNISMLHFSGVYVKNTDKANDHNHDTNNNINIVNSPTTTEGTSTVTTNNEQDNSHIYSYTTPSFSLDVDDYLKEDGRSITQSSLKTEDDDIGEELMNLHELEEEMAMELQYAETLPTPYRKR